MNGIRPTDLSALLHSIFYLIYLPAFNHPSCIYSCTCIYHAFIMHHPKPQEKFLTCGKNRFRMPSAAPDGCKMKISSIRAATRFILHKATAACGFGDHMAHGLSLSITSKWGEICKFICPLNTTRRSDALYQRRPPQQRRAAPPGGPRHQDLFVSSF